MIGKVVGRMSDTIIIESRLLHGKNKPSLEAVIKLCGAEALDEILELQNRVHSAMKNRAWFAYTSRAELESAFERGAPAVAVVSGKRMIAFAYLILDPDSSQSLVKYSDFDYTPYLGGDCVLDTVFVDPDFVGYGLQSVLIEILTSLALENGKKSVWATVHPDNIFSSRNFVKNGFKKAISSPVEKYGGVRNVYYKSTDN